jgi:hypothetical protein
MAGRQSGRTPELDAPFSFFFQDNGFSSPAPVNGSTLTRSLGDDLFIRVALNGGDLDLKLVVQNCYAQPEKNSNTSYFIIRDG